MEPWAPPQIVPGAGEMLGLMEHHLPTPSSAPLPSSPPEIAILTVLDRGTSLTLAVDQELSHSLCVLFGHLAPVNVHIYMPWKVGAVGATARNLTLPYFVVKKRRFLRFLAVHNFLRLGGGPACEEGRLRLSPSSSWVSLLLPFLFFFFRQSATSPTAHKKSTSLARCSISSSIFSLVIRDAESGISSSKCSWQYLAKYVSMRLHACFSEKFPTYAQASILVS